MKRYKFMCTKHTKEYDNKPENYNISVFIEIYATGDSYVEAFIEATRVLADKYAISDDVFTNICMDCKEISNYANEE